MDLKTKVILIRFARAFVAGALTTITAITVSDVSTWADLSSAMLNLFSAALFGGVTGVFMALDKLLRWEE